MTSYIVRSDDGREFNLCNRAARQVRVEAFNVLLRNDIIRGTVVTAPKGREMWKVDTLYATFCKCPVRDDSPALWTPITHRLNFDTWDGHLAVDMELYDEDNIRRMLDTEFDYLDVDLDLRTVRWIRGTVGPNGFEAPFFYEAHDTKQPGSFPVWWMDCTRKGSDYGTESNTDDAGGIAAVDGRVPGETNRGWGADTHGSPDRHAIGSEPGSPGSLSMVDRAADALSTVSKRFIESSEESD